MNEQHPFFRFEIVTTFATLQQYQSRWNQLLDSIPLYLPSMTYEWHHAWLTAHPELHNRLHCIFAYDKHNTLVGIIPFIETKSHIAKIPLNVLTLIGMRDHIKTIFITQPEHQLPLLSALMHYLKEEYTHWDLVAFRRLGSNRADDIFLERIAHQLHLPLTTESPLEIPYIVIDSRWEEYWKSRSKHFRHEYRRKMRKLQQKGHVSVTTLTSPLEPETFQRFVTLENSGWKGKNQSSLVHRPQLMALYQHASQMNSAYFQLLQFELWLDNHLIAASLCPQTRNGLYVYKIAYDEQWGRYSPGILLRVAEVQYAFNHHLQIYSFSGKAQPWMRQFTHRKHFTRDFIIYQHSLPAFLRHVGFDVAKPYIKRLPYLYHLLRQFIQE